jgi:hypothetical protein
MMSNQGKREARQRFGGVVNGSQPRFREEENDEAKKVEN